MAEEIAHPTRSSRVASKYPKPTVSTPIGHEWLHRFLNRYLNLTGAYSRQLESARHKEANSDKITAWCDAFQLRLQEQK
ncbi:hypothetical protein LIPSTDRAFT_337624 [Lipomyces starkeyi NRRL Y-11557]|uniref:HTH CENPB-type domain-containing protein n=1 Tax=Lipomyces starkeyi NRRL Y-11557 TaxID=675824 RepID=A0A1E3Q6G1_LIPST|nr:hypothetical protein LIPSTDRAFT_337624 [Lipomyces starkeyi NRRL Y-11557]